MRKIRAVAPATVAMMVLAMTTTVVSAADKVVELGDGTKVQAEYGHVIVPERRDRSNDGDITLPYVKLLAEGDRSGAPVFFLRGGPGHSGIDLLDSLGLGKLFNSMLIDRDVILFDQRGTGSAKPEIECGLSITLPMSPSPSREDTLQAANQLATFCANQMRVQGIDLAGYNTNESADDVADLAKHLGYNKIVLFGDSYGSHLGLTVIRRHETLIERAIFAHIEGLNDSIKRPRQIDDMLKALDEVAADPDSGWPHQELPSLAVKQLLDRFAKPRRASWVDEYGRETEVEISRNDIEQLLFRHMGKERFWRSLPGSVKRIREGDLSFLAKSIAKQRRLALRIMREAMDCASGASAERLAQVEKQLKASIVSGPFGFPNQYVCEALGVTPLPASFRAQVISNVPVLLLSGELDARTPPGNAEEVARGLPNSVHIKIAGLSHSFPIAYKYSREVRDAIQRFIDGRPTTPARYSIPFKFKPVKASNSSANSTTILSYTPLTQLPGIFSAR